MQIRTKATDKRKYADAEKWNVSRWNAKEGMEEKGDRTKLTLYELIRYKKSGNMISIVVSYDLSLRP